MIIDKYSTLEELNALLKLNDFNKELVNIIISTFEKVADEYTVQANFNDGLYKSLSVSINGIETVLFMSNITPKVIETITDNPTIEDMVAVVEDKILETKSSSYKQLVDLLEAAEDINIKPSMLLEILLASRDYLRRNNEDYYYYNDEDELVLYTNNLYELRDFLEEGHYLYKDDLSDEKFIELLKAVITMEEGTKLDILGGKYDD